MKHSVHEYSLKNNAKGLLIDIPDAPVLGVELNFRAGDYLTPKGKWEVAHVLEHMVLGSNKNYPTARGFGAEFQKNGAYKNASTGPYDLNYIVESADFEWDRILPMLTESIATPLLNDQDFAAEMGNVREELTSDLNQHFRQLIILAREHFGLVAYDDEKRIKDLVNISVEDIREYYQKTHRSDNMRFVVAGNIGDRIPAIVDTLESIDLKPGKRFELPDEVPLDTDAVHVIQKPGVSNVYFLWQMFSLRELDESERDALAMVNVMLTATLHSRILGEAREKGLVYHVSSNARRTKGLGHWWFGAEVSIPNAQPLFEIIVREIQRLLDGTIDDADVEAARNFMLGQYQRSVQTVQGVMRGYAGSYFFDDKVEDHYAIPERLKLVTKDKMLEVVQVMFADKRWGLSILGDDQSKLADDLYKQLESLYI